jgi:cell division septation protein DedD
MGSKDDLFDFALESHDDNEVMTNDHYATSPNPGGIPQDEISDEVKTESPEATKKNSKKRLYIALGIVGVLVIGVSLFFILNRTIWNKITNSDVIVAKDTTTVINPEESLVPADTTTTDLASETTSVNATDAADRENPNEKVTKIDEKKLVSEPKDWGLARPCYIISYSGFSAETKAQGDVSLLKGKGYVKTGYYWIPDYLKNGNKFFKVYVGPFNTKKEARKKLWAIKKMSPKAYVLKVDLE